MTALFNRTLNSFVPVTSALFHTGWYLLQLKSGEHRIRCTATVPPDETPAVISIPAIGKTTLGNFRKNSHPR